MSRGPGSIERRVADLFAATRHRALDISEVARHAFELEGRQPPTRAQRLSATRAAHRVVRRQHEMRARIDKLVAQAHEAVKAKLGREKKFEGDKEYDDLLEAHPADKAADALHEELRRIGTWMRFWRDEETRPGYHKVEFSHWQAITLKGRLRFHPADVPAQVWAVTIDPYGVHWFDAEVVRVTKRNVMVRYRGEITRLDRRTLWQWWAFWRGVRFVSSRTGRIAAVLEQEWHRRYGATGGVPPSMQMPLEQARALLGVAEDYTREDVIAAFRRKAKEAHPDVGGTPEMFRALVEARDRLLSAIGTSAPPPKPPQYTPSGSRVVYRRLRTGRARLGGPTRRLAKS